MALVVNQLWDNTITAQVSTDGLDGTTFGSPTSLVQEDTMKNGNPTLFRDPNTGLLHLFWYRTTSNGSGPYEIRVKSSSTFAGLIGSGAGDLGMLVAISPEPVAAPQMMFYGGTYYLVVETFESSDEAAPAPRVWKSRVLTSSSPTSGFSEIPANPVYPIGAACVFQHIEGNTLHSYYCQQNTAGDNSSWTLDHVTADLTNPPN